MFGRSFVNLVSAILCSISFCLLNSVSVSDIEFFLPTFCLLLFFFSTIECKADLYSNVSSFVISLFLGFGKFLAFLDEADTIFIWLKVAVCVVGSFVFFRVAISALYFWLDNLSVNKKPFSYKLYFFTLIFILVCWMPCWLASYPGNYPPDTINQLNQVYGIYAYNNANPLLHTLMIKGLVSFYSVFTDDMNMRVALSGLTQMIINSSIYALVVSYVYEEGGNKYLSIASALFYGLVSYNAVYNVSLSKDAMYTSSTVLLVILISKWIGKRSRLSTIFLVFIGVAYCLLRTNGYYSFIIVIGFATIAGFYKYHKKLTIILVVIFVLSSVIKYPIYSRYINKVNETYYVSQKEDNAQTYKRYFRGSFLYVVMFQQVANVVAHERELTEKEEWLIEEHAPLEVIKEVYDPILVDPIFEWVTYYTTENRQTISDVEYLKLWLELLVKYPTDYFEAYFNMTRYYFYPNRYVKPYYEGIYRNELGIQSEDVVSEGFKFSLDEFYLHQKNVPIIASFLCPGVATCFVVSSLLYSLRNKKRVSALCLMFFFANFLILMACVPLNDEFRYIYPLVSALPFIVIQFIPSEKGAS